MEFTDIDIGTMENGSWLTFLDEELLQETLEEIDYDQKRESKLFQKNIENDFFIIDNSAASRKIGITIIDDGISRSRGREFRLSDYDSGDELHLTQNKESMIDYEGEYEVYYSCAEERDENRRKSEDEIGKEGESVTSESHESITEIENGNTEGEKEMEIQGNETQEENCFSEIQENTEDVLKEQKAEEIKSEEENIIDNVEECPGSNQSDSTTVCKEDVKITDLPDHILLEIFQRTLPSPLSAIRLVNKQFNNVIKNSNLFSWKLICDFDTDLFEIKLNTKLSNKEKNRVNIEAEDMYVASDFFDMLQYSAFEKRRRKSHLGEPYTSAPDNHILILQFSSNYSISIRKTIHEILNHQCTKIMNEGLDLIWLNDGKKFEVDDTKTYLKGTKQIIPFFLTSLFDDCCDYYEGKKRPSYWIPNCNLAKPHPDIPYTQLKNFTIDAEHVLFILKDKQFAVNIKNIKFDQNSIVTKDVITKIADNCPNIEKLILSNIEGNVTDVDIKYLACKCVKLKTWKMKLVTFSHELLQKLLFKCGLEQMKELTIIARNEFQLFSSTLDGKREVKLYTSVTFLKEKEKNLWIPIPTSNTW